MKKQVQPYTPSGGKKGGSGCLAIILLVAALGALWAYNLGAGMASGGGLHFEPRAFSDNITATTGEGGQAVAVGRGSGDVTVTDNRTLDSEDGGGLGNILLFGIVFVGAGWAISKWARSGFRG